MDRIENIDFCIRYLMQRRGIPLCMPEINNDVWRAEGVHGSTPLREKQQLLRALMNIWEPQPLSDEFLRAQDVELQAQLADKGVVEIENSKLTIENVWKGDITRLKVDAIVNAANSQGLGCWQPLHNCIDNCIHSAAGLQLRQECNKVLKGGTIDTGTAIITPGYNLPCKYVIHTVGPIISAGEPPALQQREQLANCYRSCLDLAVKNGCHSIAFCCISTGVFGYPNREAAEVALRTVETFHKTSLQIIFNVFKDIDYDIYRELLGTH